MSETPMFGKGPFGDAMRAAASGMRAQATRLRIATENVANAATPGYQRKQVSFAEEMDRAGGASTVKVDRITRDDAALKRVFDPSHPAAGPDGYVSLSNVETLVEMVDIREASRTYEASLGAFDQTRKMDQSVIELLRR